MGEISELQDANGWTELEQGFFAAAPPDVAVEPPPAASFDDLSPPTPARKRTRKRARSARREVTREEVLPANRLAVAVRASGRVVGVAARAAGHVVVWSTAQLFVTARRLAPVSQLTPQVLRSGLGTLSARFAPEMPERPDAKTLVAGIAALLVVFGVSASVLGSRGPRPVVAEPAPTPAFVAPAEAAPAAAPEVAAPRPTMVLPQLDVVSQHPPAKHHRHHQHRR